MANGTTLKQMLLLMFTEQLENKEENVMAKYAIRIEEILGRTLIVEASSEEEAIKKITDAVENEDIMLSAIDDFSERKIASSENFEGGLVPDDYDVSFYEHYEDDVVIKTLPEGIMCEKCYKSFILSLCEKEWNKDVEKDTDKWSEQLDVVKEDFYENLYSVHSDMLGKSCVDCRKSYEKQSQSACSERFCTKHKQVVSCNNYCDDWEAL